MIGSQMQLAAIFALIGVIVGIPVSIYAITNPRDRDEHDGYSPRRKLFLAMGLVGGLFIIVGAIFFFAAL